MALTERTMDASGLSSNRHRKGAERDLVVIDLRSGPNATKIEYYKSLHRQHLAGWRRDGRMSPRPARYSNFLPSTLIAHPTSTNPLKPTLISWAYEEDCYGVSI